MKYHKKTIVSCLPEDENGKRVLIVSGLHGNESSAVLTAHKLEQAMATTSYRYKSVTFMTGVNESGLRADTREKKDDNKKDLNRIFGVEPAYLDELKAAIEEADIVVDVHNSPMPLVHCVLLGYNDLTMGYLRTWEASPRIPTYVWTQNNPTIISYTNSLPGKIGVTVELGGMGWGTHRDHQGKLEFLEEVMARLALLQKIETPPLPEIVGQAAPILREGLLLWGAQALGVFYHKGQVIAEVVDYDHNVQCEVISPCDGWLMTAPERVFVTPADEFVIQPIVGLPPLAEDRA